MSRTPKANIQLGYFRSYRDGFPFGDKNHFRIVLHIYNLSKTIIS